MLSFSCLSSRHLSTRLLQLSPIRSDFIHSFIPDIYTAPLQENYSDLGALSPATVKEKCLKKLAERRHNTTLILGFITHCCSSNKRSRSQLETMHITPKLPWLPIHARIASKINLPPHVLQSLCNLSIVHVIHGYAMLCSQVQRTPIIHAWGFCSNSHKYEVWQLYFLGRWT